MQASVDYRQILQMLKSEDEMIVFQGVSELAQQLSMADERSLANFSVDSFVPELIGLIKRPAITDISTDVACKSLFYDPPS